MFTRSKHTAPKAIALLTAILFPAAAPGIALLASPSIAQAQGSNSVRTRATLPYGSGRFNVSFVARSTANGAWDISAEFRPHGIGYCIDWDPCYELHGIGSGSAAAVPGVPVVIAVTGLHWDLYWGNGPAGASYPVTEYFAVAVDAQGVVSFI